MNRWEWVASEYLDNGQYGVLNGNNEIVVGIGLGLNRLACQRIAENHNRDLASAMEGRTDGKPQE